MAKKERLKKIQNNLKLAEEVFDSFLTLIEDGLLEKDWGNIVCFKNKIWKYKSQIVRMLFDPKTVNRKGKGGEINQSEVLMKNEVHKIVDKKNITVIILKFTSVLN